ncbi:hypothetical protein OIV83_003893 [Microbotryomycetes sp. JL201]|nr:hypothetical protein OIV83_003893 [Microbotryomycetes sp. JL201]
MSEAWTHASRGIGSGSGLPPSERRPDDKDDATPWPAPAAAVDPNLYNLTWGTGPAAAAYTSTAPSVNNQLARAWALLQAQHSGQVTNASPAWPRHHPHSSWPAGHGIAQHTPNTLLPQSSSLFAPAHASNDDHDLSMWTNFDSANPTSFSQNQHSDSHDNSNSHLLPGAAMSRPSPPNHLLHEQSYHHQDTINRIWAAATTEPGPSHSLHALATSTSSTDRHKGVREWLGATSNAELPPLEDVPYELTGGVGMAASSPMSAEFESSAQGMTSTGHHERSGQASFEAALLSLSVEPPLPFQPTPTSNQFHTSANLSYLHELEVQHARSQHQKQQEWLADQQRQIALALGPASASHWPLMSPPLPSPLQETVSSVSPTATTMGLPGSNPSAAQARPDILRRQSSNLQWTSSQQPSKASPVIATIQTNSNTSSPLSADRSPHSVASAARSLEDMSPEETRILAIAAAKRSNMVTSPATPVASPLNQTVPLGPAIIPTGPAGISSTTIGGPFKLKQAVGLTNGSTGRSSSSTTVVVGRGGRAGGSKKALIDMNSACRTCGDPLARLVLRGQVENLVPKSFITCLTCSPVETIDEATDAFDGDGDGNTVREPSMSSTKQRMKSATPVPSASTLAFESKTYHDTFSAAVDMLEGVKLEDGDDNLEQVVLPDRLPLNVKKDAVICDVCSRVVGTGTVTGHTPTGPGKFTVEVICTRCDALYKPCSDCGGGGGRLTPGRWRSKELFPPGRKTCVLPHTRSPALDELSFEVYRNAHIPPDLLPEFEAKCRELFVQARLGALCRPEHLSRGDGLARTFAQAERTTVDAWNLVAPMLHEDIEGKREMRRFLTLQFAKNKKSKHDASAEPERQIANINAFAIVEHDLNTGVLFFAAFAPYATTGNQYDAHYLLGEATLRKIKGELAFTNEERSLAGLAPYPSVNATFLLSVFKNESRMTQAVARRGYMTLDEYLSKYPQADPTAFPPGRQTHFPPQYVDCLRVWVKPVKSEDDYHGDPPPNVLRRRKMEKSAHTTALEALERVRKKTFEGHP